MNSSSSQWIGVRQSTLATVFLSYLLNFTLQWMARQTKQQKITYRIRNIHFKVLLYGFSALFACNLLQGGIFEALMSWGIFLMVCFLHYLNFKDTDAKKRAMADCAYYGMLVAWFIGAVVSYAITK